MPVISYAEGKSYAANLLADLNTAILAQGDWTRPNSGSRPATYKATTTRGADMVLDLADAAITTQRLQVAFYQSYDGTTLGAKVGSSRYLYFKDGNNSGTTANEYVYWTLSVSKEHIFIMVEGPRSADGFPDDGTYGSYRNYLFMTDLVPYFASGVDPNPAVVAFASRTASQGNATSAFDHKAVVNKTIGNQAWQYGSLLTLDVPNSMDGQMTATNRMGPDGNLYLSPYVYFDDAEGIRGRLSSLFYAGMNRYTDVGQNYVPVPVNSYVTYNGVKYKILAVNKTSNRNVGFAFGPLGTVKNGNQYLDSVLVAVPYAVA